MIVQLSKRTLNFIFNEETGGREWYEKYGARPSWPKGSSGITVAGGYDLGYNNKFQIKQDWTGLVGEDVIALMQSVSGLTGVKAQHALSAKLVKGIYIPYDMAREQYDKRVIKREVALTMRTFPEADKLNADTIGVLTSIVYNRGGGMNDIDVQAQDRREMRVIKKLVPLKDYKGIAAQIRSMKRLWDGIPDYTGDHENKFSGLVSRREREAHIVETSGRDYKPDELVQFEI